MNEQNRKAKKVSRMSDALFISYFIHFNQPQIRTAVITQIHSNGVTVNIPFFDMKLPIIMIGEDGWPLAWFQQFVGSDRIRLDFVTSDESLIMDADTNAVQETKVKMIIQTESGVTLKEMKLYEEVLVSLTAKVVNENTNTMKVEGVLVKEGKVSDENESIEDVLKKREAMQVEEKKDEYVALKEKTELGGNMKAMMDDAVKEVMRGHSYHF